jgi:hypothetical protein
MPKSGALDQLNLLLRGGSPVDPDWRTVLALANRALITPRLEACLATVGPPAEVVEFISEVARRNRARNALMYRQLEQAACALNAVGVTPLVLKGGACLVRAGGGSTRMLSDLDLVVAPGQVDIAVQGLVSVGFQVTSRSADPRQHAVAALGRPEDAGQIDLHQRPPGPPSFVCDPQLLSDGSIHLIGSGAVRVPPAHMHLYLQALHDQLHDGGYWRGGFDLRHAWDLADLITGDEPVQWDRLWRLPPTALTMRALETLLLRCHQLTGAEVPQRVHRWRGQLDVMRQRLQQDMSMPFAGLAAALGPIALVRHRRAARRGRPDLGLPPQSVSTSRSFARFFEILISPAGNRV